MKFTFTLKNIDTEKIHQLYNLNITSNITSNLMIKEQHIENITKLSELSLNNDDKDIVSFLDDNKDKMDNITMKDFLSLEKLPEKVDVNCYWCRNRFDWMPIGCPLKYNSSQLEKTYYSDITKDKYTIKENISSSKRKRFEDNKNEKISILEREYYEVDGIFCSFNCCLSFIQENKHNSIYKHSKNLLKKIYYDFFGKFPDNLTAAPSWRLLKEYGGNLSISEFRNKFNKVDYIQAGMIRNNLKFKMCGIVFNEKNKL